MENRFTPTKFQGAPTMKRVADGNLLTATITPGAHTWRASITWKEGFTGSGAITAYGEPQLKAALLQMDKSVKFLERSVDTSEVVSKASEQNADICEAMRTDPGVNDQAYRSACRKFGVAISLRPDFSGTSTTQKVTPLYQVLTQFDSWKSKHSEFSLAPFAEFNIALLSQYLDDENREFTTVNLDQAYAELSEASMFKSADTGRRGGRIVQPYDHARLIANRKARAAVIEPPANLSPVDDQCWRLVHSKFPRVDVRSQRFRNLCSTQILDWARENALKEGFTDENEGPMRQRCDQIITDWGRQSKPTLGTGNKAAVDRRIWLG